jgi:hypothetical protein
MGYYQDQISNVLKENNASYKLKLTGESSETNWMSITAEEAKKIRKILNRP